MSAVAPRPSPASVASLPGGEAAKLLQRFHQLEPANRARLLESALNMIGHQEDAKLPPRERAIKRLVDRIERCLEAIAEDDGRCRIKSAVWRGMVDQDKAELAALGVDYFGSAAVSRRAA